MSRGENVRRWRFRRAQEAEGVTLELTVLPDRIFYASTAEESQDADGPHPDLPLAGEGVWENLIDRPPADFGLPCPIVAWQADGSVAPAVAEFQLVTGFADAGDPAAQQALGDLGLLCTEEA